MQASDRLPTAVSVYAGWGKEKTIHPKTKGLERRKKPTQEQSISTVQTKQQHREQGKRCEGGDTQTQTPEPSRDCLPKPPQQAASVPHSTASAPVHCFSGDQVPSPAMETHDSDQQRQILKTHPVGGWGKQNQEENETPAIPAHPHGTQPSAGRVLVPHSQPLGLPWNQTPPHRHSALLAQVKREQSSCGETTREHPGPQVPEWEEGWEQKEVQAPGQGVPRTSSGTGTSVRL